MGGMGMGEREVQEGGDIGIPIADSLHCIVEHCKATTIPLKKKKNFKNKNNKKEQIKVLPT